MKYILYIFFLVSGFVAAQDTTNTGANPFGAADSVVADTSVISDTSAVADSAGQGSDIDAVVYASSNDSMAFDIRNQMMKIYGSGKIEYKESSLESGKVNVDFRTNSMEAFGIKDTADSARGELVQTPELTEEGQTYEGRSLRYNFKTKRGYITLAKNREEGQRYEGEIVNKVTEDVYFIKDGTYTTCESDTPDTYFTADEMKVIQKDKIVAKWIFMYIGGVPLPVPLPFGVFPNERGRRSGIIVPGYGVSQLRGQEFTNFGYYWAASDYFDLATTMSYYSLAGYHLNSRLRYNKRYSFSGNITGGYLSESSGEETDPGFVKQKQWHLGVTHNQQFTPSARLSANLRFQSNDYYRATSVDQNQALNNTISSDANFYKSWDESGNSLSISYSRTQNLNTGNIQETLPNVSFSKRVSYPFRDESSRSSDLNWYEYLSYQYSGNFLNKRNKTEGELNSDMGLRHNINFSANPKLGYFNISPNVNYTEKWYNKYTVYVPQGTDSTYEVAEHNPKAFKAVRTFSTGVTASTKLYGMLQPQALGIAALRHTLIPKLTYSYSPDFSDEMWGYYDSYVDSAGNEVRYDRFGNEVFGGGGSGEQQNLRINIGNVFEMKTMEDPTDTTSEAQKITLLNLNASTSYNFAADTNKLSDLSLTFSTSIGQFLRFSGNSNYTFYDYDGGRRLKEFLASKGKGLLRLTRLSFSVSTSISGDRLKSKDKNQEDEETEGAVGNTFDRQEDDYISVFDRDRPDFAIPWNINLDYSYSMDKADPTRIRRTSLGRINMSANLTPNWKIGVSGSYDFERKYLSAPSINISRDLHCWEMDFRWNPIGAYSGFRFEIRMKAPQLQDIKVTKSGGRLSRY